MAKRWLLAFLVAILLVGCAVEQPPVYVTYTPAPTATPVIPGVTATHVLVTNTPIATDAPTSTRAWRIGYNANGQAVPDQAYYLDQVRATCSRTQLVMDDMGLANKVYAILKACLPGGIEPIVIHRDFSSQEGGECTQTSAEAMVARWVSQGNPHIVRYSVNEPVYNEQNWPDCLRREIRLMELARAQGFTVSMSNFPVGYIQPQWIEAGIFDDYLRALNRYQHYLGVHEYTSAVLAFGVGLWPRECLLDPACVQPQNWPTVDDLPLMRWPVQAQSDNSFGFEMLNKAYARGGYTAQAATATLPPYWHTLRFVWYWIRQDEIGEAQTPVLITEAPWDHMNDIENVLTPLEDDWAFARYLWDLRGINTYYDATPQVDSLWEYYWPQWSHEEAALCQLIWLNTIYPDGVAGVTMFTWSTNPMWINFDFSGRQNDSLYRLHRLLERQASGENLWESICLRAA